MKTRITLDDKVQRALGFSNSGYPPYIGYSEIKVKDIKDAIELLSTKREVDKRESLTAIDIHKEGDYLSLYGIGSGTFWIGRFAKLKNEENDKG